MKLEKAMRPSTLSVIFTSSLREAEALVRRYHTDNFYNPKPIVFIAGEIHKPEISGL